MIQTILLFTLRPGVTDEDACRRWFGHPEHARVRAELLAPPHRAPGTLPDPDLSP
jgi:hypothetical protein